jgi:hypothetical protein
MLSFSTVRALGQIGIRARPAMAAYAAMLPRLQAEAVWKLLQRSVFGVSTPLARRRSSILGRSERSILSLVATKARFHTASS